MAIPVLGTFAAGQRWRGADVNTLTDAVTFAFTAKSCRATSAATPSISNATWTELTFGNESFDTDSWHSTSVDTDQIVPDIAGIFRVEIQVAFAPDATGMRGVRIYKNTTQIAGVQQAASTGGTMTLLYAATTMNANGSTDYFSAECYQASGGALALETSATATTFTVTWIGA